MNDFFENLFNPQGSLYSLLAIIIAVAAAVIAHLLIFRSLKLFARKAGAENLQMIVKKINTPAFFLLIIMAVYLVMPILDLKPEVNRIIRHVLSLALIVFVAGLVIKAVQVLRYIMQHKYDIEAEDNLLARRVYTQFRILERIVILIVIIIAIATALMTFDRIRQVGLSLLASAGLAGIIIGLAAQRTIATLLAGFQIAITQPIRIDDVVIVEGEWGRIEEITLTYVVVRIWDKRRLVVPTTFFIEQPFQNWTRVSADLLGTVFLYTDYRVPVEKVREELNRVVKASPLWDGDVCVLQVTDVKERTVEIRCLVSAPDSGTAFDLRVHIREKMIEFLQKNYPESLPHTRIKLEGEKAAESKIS